MKCDVFWKRIVTLCLTFWLGIFVQNFFALKDLPEIEVFDLSVIKEEIVPENKKNEINLNSKQRHCEPADKNLKYQLLNDEDVLYPVAVAKERENGSHNRKRTKPIEIEKKQERTGKPIQEIEKQLYELSKNQIQIQNLLHKENCYESDGRK